MRVPRLVWLFPAILLVLTAFLAAPASAGTIVVNNDEWTLGNTGFTNAPDTGTFVANVAAYFTGGGSGTFYGYSTNFGLTQSALASAFSTAGHTWAHGTGITWDLPTLLGYDGIFLGGTTVPDLSVLAAYVNAGGNVYLAGGTAAIGGGAAGEAAYWNTFLNAFGLAFGSTYNGVGGNQPIASAHPIFSGVSALYQNNGNDTFDLAPLDPANAVLVTNAAGHGLYAIYESGTPPAAAVPLPGAAPAGLALLGLLFAVRRRRRALADR